MTGKMQPKLACWVIPTCQILSNPGCHSIEALMQWSPTFVAWRDRGTGPCQGVRACSSTHMSGRLTCMCTSAYQPATHTLSCLCAHPHAHSSSPHVAQFRIRSWLGSERNLGVGDPCSKILIKTHSYCMFGPSGMICRQIVVKYFMLYISTDCHTVSAKIHCPLELLN